MEAWTLARGDIKRLEVHHDDEAFELWRKMDGKDHLDGERH